MKDTEMKTSLFNSMLPAILALAIGAIVILIIGENPISAYGIMFGKSLFTINGLSHTLHASAPLLLTSIAIAICFRVNLFNMGVEGQMVFGGFMAGIAGAYFHIGNSILHILLCMVIGMAAGVLFALFVAILRAYFRVDEMVVTLTLNYAVVIFLEFLSSGPFRDPGAGYVSTPVIQETAMFTRIGSTRITTFFFISLAVFIVFWFMVKKTSFGYKLKSIGNNPQFAEATGLRVRRQIMILMLISGAISGLAGAGHMMSEEFKYTLSFSGSPGLGWDGMLVSLLGAHSPLGILIACIFYSSLKIGADNINMYTDIPTEIVAVIQGLMILFLSIRFISHTFGEKRNASGKGGNNIGTDNKHSI